MGSNQALLAKGYSVAYQEVAFGHNWQNWQPLLDDVLQYYFGDANSQMEPPGSEPRLSAIESGKHGPIGN